jgi:hypothetical protein
MIMKNPETFKAMLDYIPAKDKPTIITFKRSDLEGTFSEDVAREFAAVFSPDALSPETLRRLMGTCAISIDGYEGDKRPVVLIPEIQRFFKALYVVWPFAYFFLNSKEDITLYTLACQKEITAVPSSRPGFAEFKRDPVFLRNFVEHTCVAMAVPWKKAGLSEEHLGRRVSDIHKMFIRLGANPNN